MQQQSAFQRRKNFFERKRFLNYQAHNPLDFQKATEKDSRGSPSLDNQPYNNKHQDQKKRGHPAASAAYDRVPMDAGKSQHNTMNIEDNNQNQFYNDPYS